MGRKVSTEHPAYTLRRRLSRRGVLALGGLAAVVAACGGDGDSKSGQTSGTSAAGGSAGATSGSPAAGGAAQGKVGGTFRHAVFGVNSGDPPTLYPYENISYQTQTISANHYSRLLRGAVGPNIGSDFTKVEGDLAQGVPEQPDPLTYIFKLKPNITFHDKPPMNGRKATAQDFLATYDFFINQAINRARFADIVDKVEAPDQQTVKFTLKGPNATFIVNGAASDQGLWFIPVETINNDQAKKDPVGTGPWVFKSYTPGVQFIWERHPKYHDSPMPYFSKIEASTNRDPQRIMAALQSGDYDYSGSLVPSQLADIKSKLDPKGQTVTTKSGSINGFIFNFNNTPWNDKRVRQALSMAIDRTAALKVLDPTGNTSWNSFFGPALVPYYIDPQDQAKFGPNAKYFQRNVAEAKKLLQAATGSDTLSVNIISNVDRYGPSAQQQWELIASNIKDAGFQAQNVYQEYGAYIQSNYFGKISDPKGITLGPLIGTVLDPDDMFMTCYWSKSERHNWGGNPIPEQAQLDAMFEKQRTILNLEERTAYIQDIQRMMADSFLSVPTVNAGGLLYIPPWVLNAHYKGTYATMADTFAKAYFTDERLKKG